jgi:DNA replication protein DnaC
VTNRAELIGIPGGLAADVRDESFKPNRPVVNMVVRFLAEGDPRRILVVAGPPGTGKSAAAAHGLMNAKTANQIVRYYDQRDATHGEAVLSGAPLDAHWIQARVFWTKVFERALWDHAERVSVLVVDDLGAEPEDQRVTPLISSLLCQRVDMGLKTLVTTNMDPGMFGRRYGPRLVDRLEGEAWFGSSGPSLRGRASLKMGTHGA